METLGENEGEKASKGGGSSKNNSCAPARLMKIQNKLGLHARAAAKFVKLVGSFDVDLWVSKDGQTVSGRSIMGLMMLAAGLHSEIELSATGPQAEKAVKALCALIENKFDED